MRKKNPDTTKVIARVARDPARGTAFWWLYDQHDAITAAAIGTRIPWKTLFADINRLGLQGGNSQPVSSPKALKQTFDRVRELRAREAAAWAARAKRKPRKIHDGPPPVVSSPVPIPRRQITDTTGLIYACAEIGSQHRVLVKVGQTARADVMQRVRELPMTKDTDIKQLQVWVASANADRYQAEAQVHRALSLHRVPMTSYYGRELYIAPLVEVLTAIREATGEEPVMVWEGVELPSL